MFFAPISNRLVSLGIVFLLKSWIVPFFGFKFSKSLTYSSILPAVVGWRFLFIPISENLAAFVKHIIQMPYLLLFLLFCHFLAVLNC